MGLPPGLAYLLRLVPYFVIPSATVFALLRLSQQYQTAVSIPSWFAVTATILAWPALVFFNIYYTKLANKRAAAAHGAILAPLVPESVFSVLPKLVEGSENGLTGDLLYRWSRKYGNAYQVNLPTTTTMVTLEPHHIKAILATQFESFEKGPVFFKQLSSFLGEGVFNADGEMWKFHRAMTRPFFTRERISDFEIYNRNCDISLKVAKNRLAEGCSIDFQDLTSRFTLDSATEFLLGYNVGSLSAGIPYAPSSAIRNPAAYYEHPSTAFTNTFMEAQVLSVKRLGRGPQWPLAEIWADKVTPLRKAMDDVIEPMITEALTKREREVDAKSGDEKSEEDVTLLAHLVKHTQDPKILKDEVLNLLVAGRDTTMSLLTFSFYMLTEHPDIEHRLRQEIIDKVGPAGAPTYDQMREMKYMRAFLNEVLRLYPPVPVNGRTANKPTILPGNNFGQKPIYVPADITCIYTVLGMHRRTDLWGPDGRLYLDVQSRSHSCIFRFSAMKFDPDRFLDERLHKYLTPNPFIFCPFNAGPRICLGQQFAYHEATFYLVRLLQQFTDFTLDQSNIVQLPAEWASEESINAREKVYPATHLTTYVKGGLWIRMKEFSDNGA
ncbi:cytochrome P450 monooxygenase pc-2 [Flammula alnicola]|nr:cytochrome P450 monooxygenase pc-2 [Flammula alnicola]